MHSIVIPVYKNEASLPALLSALANLASEINDLEVVFVVDGSPDRSYPFLREHLEVQPFASQLIGLSRNFGSFAAIRTGLTHARGDLFAVMAADLQEPPELMKIYFSTLKNASVDIVVGEREARSDPIGSRIAAKIFWGLYRRLINSEIPPGGVDVFACNRQVRDQLVALEEHNTSLVGLLYWIGFRRETVRYQRLPREHGRSAWTLRRKLKYMLDSIFAFSDLPIRILLSLGIAGLLVAGLLATIVIIIRIRSGVAVPGYAAIMITILFFGALNATGLGLLGAYLWRAFANTQQRPLAIVMQSNTFQGIAHSTRGEKST